MTTATLVKKIDALEKEVAFLRTAFMSTVPADTEGEYRPEFIKSMKAAMKRKPTHAFTTVEEFRKLISKRRKA